MKKRPSSKTSVITLPERSLYNLCAEAVTACLQGQDAVLPADVPEYLLRTQPEAIERHKDAAIRSGLLRLIRDLLKTSTLDDGLETGEMAEQDLPGMKTPTTVPILQPDGEYKYMRFEKMTASDFQQAMETKRQGIVKDQARLRDFQLKWRVLKSYLLRDPAMTVEQALALHKKAA